MNSKNCLSCQRNFTKKEVFSPCADCKTCPNICDSCQLKVNQKQQEISEKLKTDPNFSLTAEVEFIRVEVSQEYPFLIKETFIGKHTQKKLEVYCYWKVVEGVKILYLPTENTERDKQIVATTKWIDFSHQNKAEYIDLRSLRKEKGICSHCKKENWVITVSFSEKEVKECSACLAQITKEVKETEENRKMLVVIRELQKILEE